jgi:hypothetical protein
MRGILWLGLENRWDALPVKQDISFENGFEDRCAAVDSRFVAKLFLRSRFMRYIMLSHLVAGGTFFSAIGHRLHNTGGHPTKFSASGAPPKRLEMCPVTVIMFRGFSPHPNPHTFYRAKKFS